MAGICGWIADRWTTPRVLLLALLWSLSGCSGSAPSVVLKGERFGVEIADDTEEQRMGLMFREEMDDNRGMLFVFPAEAPRSFWMKNTRIALDIFYFNRRLTLVSVQENVPPCRSDPCPNYPSKGPAKYVLELNAGSARRLGVAPGDSLILDL